MLGILERREVGRIRRHLWSQEGNPNQHPFTYNQVIGKLGVLQVGGLVRHEQTPRSRNVLLLLLLSLEYYHSFNGCEIENNQDCAFNLWLVLDIV